MNNISIYADTAKIETDGTSGVVVNLNNVEVSQVVAEFSYADVLDALEFSDVVAYVNEQMRLAKEDLQDLAL